MELSADELGRQLLAVPEVNLEALGDLRLAIDTNEPLLAAVSRRPPVPGRNAFATAEYREFLSLRQTISKLQEEVLRQAREFGLPVRLGPVSQLSPLEALSLQRLSKDIHALATPVVPGGVRFRSRPGTALPEIQPGALEKLLDVTWESENIEKHLDVVPTVVQMLQVEETPVRLLLVQELAKVRRKAAAVALAERALFDLSPEVRRAAVSALRKRPRPHYLPKLIEGLRYPWTPVADHAGRALVELNDPTAVPELVELLDRPDPAHPVWNLQRGQYVVGELVRINHMRNCYLCHTPSYSTADPIRGRVPTPGKPLPVAYYQARGGDFVRADVTFLHQDFSLMQPVADAAPWPDPQRFDFVVRRRAVPTKDLARYGLPPDGPPPGKDTHSLPAPSYPQRDVVLRTLRKLTGKDLGTDGNRWRASVGLKYTVAPTPTNQKSTPASESTDGSSPGRQ